MKSKIAAMRLCKEDFEDGEGDLDSVLWEIYKGSVRSQNAWLLERSLVLYGAIKDLGDASPSKVKEVVWDIQKEIHSIQKLINENEENIGEE